MVADANWFIALPVDPEALPPGTIAGLPAGLKRIHPADLHVTVAFLGAVGEPRALATWEDTAAIDAGPFELCTGGRAALGRPSRPSAYGLDLTGEPEFVQWLATWRDRLRAVAGVAAETREVKPHVTLARPPRRAGTAIRRRARAWLDQTPPETRTLRFDRIALYTAAASGACRRYQIVRERSLPPAR